MGCPKLLGRLATAPEELFPGLAFRNLSLLSFSLAAKQRMDRVSQKNDGWESCSWEKAWRPKLFPPVAKPSKLLLSFLSAAQLTFSGTRHFLSQKLIIFVLNV